MRSIKLSAIALLGGLALWVVAFALASRLPAPAANAALHNEPEQTPTQIKEFTRQINGHKYAIKPVFDYRLQGRVVSMSDAMGWSNISHKAANDYLNSHDFCVVWGNNVELANLNKISITHGDWTCYVQWSSREAAKHFDLAAVANNHVLPDTPEIEKMFQTVQIGDDIEIAGQLVDYVTDNNGGARKTSIVRNDTGCEIIYVTEFKFLKRHNPLLYRIASFGKLVSALGLLSLLVSVFVLPFLRKS